MSQVHIREVIQVLYSVLLNRSEPGVELPPTDAELDFWADAVEATGSLEAVLRTFLSSPELQKSFFVNWAFRELLAPEPLEPNVVRLHHLHIPKTAGYSLRAALATRFNDMESLIGVTLGQMYRLSWARLRSYRFFSGHFGVELRRLLPEVPFVTVTTLRDPVAWTTSAYAYIRREGHPEVRTQAHERLAHELTFHEWVRHPDTLMFWRNYQSRFVCLRRRADPWPRMVAPNVEGSSESVEDEPVPADTSLYERAQRELSRIEVVGVTSHLDVSVREVFRAMGLSTEQEEVPVSNTSDGSAIRDELDDSSVALIERESSVDLELFRSALASMQRH